MTFVERELEQMIYACDQIDDNKVHNSKIVFWAQDNADLIRRLAQFALDKKREIKNEPRGIRMDDRGH